MKRVIKGVNKFSCVSVAEVCWATSCGFARRQDWSVAESGKLGSTGIGTREELGRGMLAVHLPRVNKPVAKTDVRY